MAYMCMYVRAIYMCVCVCMGVRVCICVWVCVSVCSVKLNNFSYVFGVIREYTYYNKPLEYVILFKFCDLEKFEIIEKII